LKKSKTFTSKVLEICDNGDAIIELPPELLEEVGWKEGDTLNIEQREDKRIYISKVKDA
jgi:bifunctional DNA-binding transcriptional regulator/antitoxin component of YhaV-PrlF toxin-antitoxin module